MKSVAYPIDRLSLSFAPDRLADALFLAAAADSGKTYFRFEQWRTRDPSFGDFERDARMSIEGHRARSILFDLDDGVVLLRRAHGYLEVHVATKGRTRLDAVVGELRKRFPAPVAEDHQHVEFTFWWHH